MVFYIFYVPTADMLLTECNKIIKVQCNVNWNVKVYFNAGDVLCLKNESEDVFIVVVIMLQLLLIHKI